jgi:hypothetical protein
MGSLLYQARIGVARMRTSRIFSPLMAGWWFQVLVQTTKRGRGTKDKWTDSQERMCILTGWWFQHVSSIALMDRYTRNCPIVWGFAIDSWTNDAFGLVYQISFERFKPREFDYLSFSPVQEDDRCPSNHARPFKGSPQKRYIKIQDGPPQL